MLTTDTLQRKFYSLLYLSLLHTHYIIIEDEKTTAQKDRAAHLLRELLELIDERDKLERKRMSTESK